MSEHIQVLRVSRGTMRNVCYVVHDESRKGAIAIDPAWNEALMETALGDAKLHAILLTHSHRDHVDLAQTLARRHHCPVMMSMAEVDAYRFRCHGLHGIHSEGTLQFGGTQVAVHATPGHTLGGLCYQTSTGVFTGDTLFAEGCGLCAGKGADPGHLYRSLRKLNERLNDDVRVYPGHTYGMPVGQTLATVREHNIYLHFRDADAFARFRMRPGQQGLFEFR